MIDPENEAQWKAEWERHHFGQCDCDQQVEERTAAVRTYFAAHLLADTDGAPSSVELRDAVRLLDEWAQWHCDDERGDDDPQLEPLPADLAAHADDVVPGAALCEGEADWRWGGAMSMIGINGPTYAALAMHSEELGPKLQKVADAQAFAIGALANIQAELEDEDAREVVRSALEEQEALLELLTGREPELIDPSLLELDEDEET